MSYIPLDGTVSLQPREVEVEVGVWTFLKCPVRTCVPPYHNAAFDVSGTVTIAYSDGRQQTVGARQVPPSRRFMSFEPFLKLNEAISSHVRDTDDSVEQQRKFWTCLINKDFLETAEETKGEVEHIEASREFLKMAVGANMFSLLQTVLPLMHRKTEVGRSGRNSAARADGEERLVKLLTFYVLRLIQMNICSSNVVERCISEVQNIIGLQSSEQEAIPYISLVSSALGDGEETFSKLPSDTVQRIFNTFLSAVEEGISQHDPPDVSFLIEALDFDATLNAIQPMSSEGSGVESIIKQALSFLNTNFLVRRALCGNSSTVTWNLNRLLEKIAVGVAAHSNVDILTILLVCGSRNGVDLSSLLEKILRGSFHGAERFCWLGSDEQEAEFDCANLRSEAIQELIHSAVSPLEIFDELFALACTRVPETVVDEISVCDINMSLKHIFEMVLRDLNDKAENQHPLCMIKSLALLRVLIAAVAKGYSVIDLLGNVLEKHWSSLVQSLSTTTEVRKTIVDISDAVDTDSDSAKWFSEAILTWALPDTESESQETVRRLTLGAMLEQLREEPEAPTFIAIIEALTSNSEKIIPLLGYEQLGSRQVAAQIIARIWDLSEEERKSLLMTNPEDSSSETKTPEDVADFTFRAIHNFQESENEGSQLTSNPSDAASVEHSISTIRYMKEHMKDYQADNSDSYVTSMPTELRICQPEGYDPAATGSKGSLTMTPTTKQNLRNILQFSDKGGWVLLEGDTGAGKSSIVAEAANLTGCALLRMNLSSSTTVGELLGKVQLTGKADRAFEFLEAPFLRAFREGKWILLDELNLASDDVLQTIEKAAEQDWLAVRDPTTVNEPVRYVSKHPSFRLFATQNPSSGLFKGKREKLSGSFLSRFQIFQFHPLPSEEWEQVVKNKFMSGGGLDSHTASVLAGRLVPLHQRVVRFMSTLDETKEDPNVIRELRKSYSVLSTRELFKTSDLIASLAETKDKSKLLNGNFMLHCASHVYLGRFRYPETRNRILANIASSIGTDKDEYERDSNATIRTSQDRVIFSDESCPWISDVTLNRKRFNTGPDSVRDITRIYTLLQQRPQKNDRFATLIKEEKLLSLIINMHMDVIDLISDLGFIEQHGLYSQFLDGYNFEGEDVFLEFCSTLNIEPGNDKRVVGEAASQVYVSQFRSRVARQKVAERVRSRIGNVSIDQDLCRPRSPPLVITKRVKRVWYQLAQLLQTQYPILLEGPAGCGKSRVITDLAKLLGQDLETINMTPESEPADLVGQLAPAELPDDSESHKQPIKWTDGPVTKAFTHGRWTLINDMNQADSRVIERLNPALEVPPSWNVAEKPVEAENEVLLDGGEGFRVLCSMSPPERGIAGETELSPAVANRINVIQMPELPCPSDKDAYEVFVEEMKTLSEGNIGDELSEAEHTQIGKACWRLWIMLHDKSGLTSAAQNISTRFFVRLLDGACRLHWGGNSPGLLHCLLQCMVTTLRGSTEEMNKCFAEELGVETGSNAVSLRWWDTTADKERLRSHVIPESRRSHVEAVAIAIQCDIPVLLEGESAVGKTSLVQYLCHCRSSRLERVNNTENTVLQDYFGAPVPSEKGFIQKPGALARAMENGHFFLADEMNLAPASVLSVLKPILDGSKRIYVPGFQKPRIFFASRFPIFFAGIFSYIYKSI